MFIYNLKAVAKKMKIDFKEITSKIEHPSEMGRSREELLKTYLSQFLPLKYTIGNGFVVDSNNNKSKQQDFIIYDAFNSPLMLKMESLQIIPIESVYCTIEIKSTLTKSELQKCVDNIQSVRSLKKGYEEKKTLQFGGGYINNFTIGFVFAYTADSSLEAILENLKEMNKSIDKKNQISLVCILNRGIILNVDVAGMNNLQMYPDENSVLISTENDLEDNLAYFYLFLLDHLNKCNLLPPDLIQYAVKQNSFNIKPSLNVKDLPDEGYTNTVAGAINNKDAKESHKAFTDIKPYFKNNLTKEEFENVLIVSENMLTATNGKAFLFSNGLTIDLETIKCIIKLKKEIQDEITNNDSLEKYNKLIDELYIEYNKHEGHEVTQ